LRRKIFGIAVDPAAAVLQIRYEKLFCLYFQFENFTRVKIVNQVKKYLRLKFMAEFLALYR